jgi:hypothetical protein
MTPLNESSLSPPLPRRAYTRAWSHPVLANGELYLRDQDVLLCYDVKAR